MTHQITPVHSESTCMHTPASCDLLQADTWSTGITLIELADMNPPYHEMSPMRVLLKITRSEPPSLELPHKWSAQPGRAHTHTHTHKSAYPLCVIRYLIPRRQKRMSCVCVCCRSKNFNNFLAKCLTKNPDHRSSATELLQHPFVASVTDHRPLRALYQVRLVHLSMHNWLLVYVYVLCVQRSHV